MVEESGIDSLPAFIFHQMLEVNVDCLVAEAHDSKKSRLGGRKRPPKW